MAPLTLMWYSLVGLGDLTIALFLAAAMLGVLQNTSRTIIQIYFQEQEKFMRRMAAMNIPPTSELMH